MLSEAKHLLSYAPFLRLHSVQQIASALHWYHRRYPSPHLGAQERRQSGFTRDYKVHRLVYYETFKYVNNAIAREKSIKG
jgi:hypothetical protein